MIDSSPALTPPSPLTSLEAGDQPEALSAGSEPVSLPSGDELARAALGVTSDAAADADHQSPQSVEQSVDEVAASDALAQTLGSLQNVIERNANELKRIADELKHKRESLKNVFENDTTLAEAEAQLQTFASEVKERKSKLQVDPQVTTLKVQIGELNEQKKEVEETLSNHLVNYYQLTNSTSFDTSDGDQWEFAIRAKVKPRGGKQNSSD